MKNKEESQNIIRDPYWDNIRFFLILAVVIGHFVDYNTSKSELCKTTYLFIYIFHMPLFIFVSGFFSKNTLLEKKKVFKKAIYYFVLFIIYKLIIFILSFFFNKKIPTFLPFSESGIPWFFLASSIWLILFYFLKEVKPLPLFIVSILVGCLIGYDRTTQDFLCWSRVLVFLPFFAAGYYTSQSKIDNFINRKKKFRFIALFIFIISALLIYENIEYFYKYRGYFTARNPFYILINGQYGCLVRCITILISFYFILLILLIASRKKTLFSYIGSKTLQIYFWHYPLLYTMLKLKILDFFRSTLSDGLFYLFLVSISVIVTFILSLKIFGLPLKLLENRTSRFINLVYDKKNHKPPVKRVVCT